MPVKLVGFTELASKLGKVATDITSINERATKKAALKAKELSTDAIQPKTLSHWGRGGKKGGYSVKSVYDILGPGEIKLRPTPAALAVLLTKGSGDTWKAPHSKGAPRRKKGSVGTYTRTPVPPRGAWDKGEAVVAVRWPHDYEVAVNAELRKIIPEFTSVV